MIMQNVTTLLESQQQMCDKKYKDAIEANFSHEQMTPLNGILACSKIVLKRVVNMTAQLNRMNNANDASRRQQEELFGIIKSIHQAGQSLWFFNQNQI